MSDASVWMMGPHMNKLMYEGVKWPIFPPDFPQGIRREDMPQLPKSRSNPVWMHFISMVESLGGIASNKTVDITKAYPLQGEISGAIVHNQLIGEEGLKMQWKLEETEDGGNYFAKVVLIQTPQVISALGGKSIPRGSYLVLDGHHAWDAARVCDRSAPRTLRGGFASEYNSLCGPNFPHS